MLTTYLRQLRLNATPGPLEPKLAAVFPSPDEAFDNRLAELDAPDRADAAAL